MDRIYLTGISAFAFHGVYENERREGQKFSVDLVAELDLYPAGMSDELKDSVDYALMTKFAHEELAGEPCNLIEAVAERIASRLLREFEQIQRITVKLHKPDADVGTALQDIAIEIVRERS
jgi:dihydroneopterin aldolase